jgi:hypothetical protein
MASVTLNLPSSSARPTITPHPGAAQGGNIIEIADAAG